jgi:hypothetical protein
MSLGALKATLKNGTEQLTYNDQALDFSLLDFWKWSVSDILSNATRGRFAEFIVATAINIEKTQVRNEWGVYDLETPEGVKLEIKSAAYIQTWFQKTLSTISFGTRATRFWDETSSQYVGDVKRHADVYVFCLLHHQDKQTIDPLNLNQWEFYVLATCELNGYTRSQHSITLKSLKKLTEAISYDQLHKTITDKNKLNV